VSYRCPACKRRVRSALYVSLQDRHTREITRCHGNVTGCLEAARLRGRAVRSRRGRAEVRPPEKLWRPNREAVVPGDVSWSMG